VAPVLLIGLDPRKIAGFDPAPVELAIKMGHKRFVDAGIEVDTCLVEIDAAARAIIATALQAKPYGVVVVGGGIRKPDDLVELLEDVIDLIRHHAPQAAIAFNTNPITSVDAVKRRMP
jgi:nucleoside-diphosphate-sugar epimerase